MDAGGYKDVLLWHAEGWDWKNENDISSPAYWHKIDDEWHQYTMNGLVKLNQKAPVTHISYFEAFAYSQWKGMRLPTEEEWESAKVNLIGERDGNGPKALMLHIPIIKNLKEPLESTMANSW